MVVAIYFLLKLEGINMQQLSINRKENEPVKFSLSDHAFERMHKRAIAKQAIETVLTYGRLIRSRRACFYVIGKRELHHLQKTGVDIYRLENTQVVVDEKSSTVITVYKNNNFRKIRPIKRCERKLH